MGMSEGGAAANVANVAAKGGNTGMIVKGVLGLGALVGTVFALDRYAHPERPNTTPDNPYGLAPTGICDEYSQMIIKDWRGRLWSKSTYTRLKMNQLPPLHMCSQQELVDNGVSSDPAGAGADGAAAAAGAGGVPMAKRSIAEARKVRCSSRVPVGKSAVTHGDSCCSPQDDLAELAAIVKRDVNNDHTEDAASESSVVLEKRAGSGGLAGVAGMAFLPSLGWSGGLAIGATAIVTAMYLHHVHEAKQQALLAEWNSQYHSAGDAASSVGNAISTGANGQLFNPITGNLVLVDPNTGMYYDSGSGEQVNPKTGMPFRYGGGSSSDSKPKATAAQQVPQQLPLNGNGQMPAESPEVQQAMAQWNAMTPQQQQQLMQQYGGAAQQILNSPDPNAAFQQYTSTIAQQTHLPQQQQYAQQQPQYFKQPQYAQQPQYAAGAGAGDGSVGPGAAPVM